MPDIGERIQIYRRLSSAESLDEIADLESEMRDRFGNFPIEVINLLGIMRLRWNLKQLHVIRLSSGPKKTSLQFAESTPAKPELLIQLISKNREKYSITPDQKLVFTCEEATWQNLLHEVQLVADRIMQN